MANEAPKEEGGFAEAMMLEDGEEKTRRLEKAASDLRVEMETDAERIRALIAAQPPTSLLGYLWSQYFMGVLQQHQDGGEEAGPDKELINKFQFVLEYVHAVWSAHEGAFAEGQIDEAKARELLEVCEKLSNTAMFWAMASSQLGKFNEFGSATPHVEFQAKSTWTLIRGHRYQVLEREFFEFVLVPHEEALKKAYGIGAVEIAAGMQTIADTIRGGYSDAASALFEGSSEARHLSPTTACRWKRPWPRSKPRTRTLRKKLVVPSRICFSAGPATCPSTRSCQNRCFRTWLMSREPRKTSSQKGSSRAHPIGHCRRAFEHS